MQCPGHFEKGTDSVWLGHCTSLLHALGAVEWHDIKFFLHHFEKVIDSVLYAQGAAEMVLDRCTRYIETNGSTANLNDDKRRELGDIISNMADKGLRTLCLAYRDYSSSQDAEVPEDSPDEDLTACCIVGIKVGCPCH